MSKQETHTGAAPIAAGGATEPGVGLLSAERLAEIRHRVRSIIPERINTRYSIARESAIDRADLLAAYDAQAAALAAKEAELVGVLAELMASSS